MHNNMYMKKPPTILVIFGITGDLSRRKLLPALAEIQKSGELPEKFKVIGVSRQSVDVAEVLQAAYMQDDQRRRLESCLSIFTMDVAAVEDYQRLGATLNAAAAAFGSDAQALFYLSLPPLASKPVIDKLGLSGLAAWPNAKLLLEKPFGTDLPSARDLIDHIKQHFAEEQIYRIDHYLAKEMAQNIAVFRGGNSLFKSTWNNQFIESIEVIATENIGIEGRAAFYEQTGALRDIAQSHLLQLAALVLMPFATETQHAPIPERRLQALRNLRLDPNTPVEKLVWRGQYLGYLDEVGNPDSSVETALYMTLESVDPRWLGVPIRILTGKAMAQKTTEIRIQYRKQSADESNQLVMRINPSEAIDVYLWAKKPGYRHKLEKVALSYTYADYYEKLPEPYEQVILDAICSERALFTSSDEVIAAWKIVEPIVQNWQSAARPQPYAPGSSVADISDGLFTGAETDPIVD